MNTAAPGVLPGVWSAVADASACRFSARDKLVLTAHGTMPLVGGEVVVADSGQVVRAWVEVSVAGIVTGIAARDKHLKQAGILDADSHPRVRIELDQGCEVAEAMNVHGTVVARGARAPVDLMVRTERVSDHDVRVHVTGRLARKPLGIKVPMLIVGPFVDLDADVTFRRVDTVDG